MKSLGGKVIDIFGEQVDSIHRKCVTTSLVVETRAVPHVPSRGVGKGGNITSA